MKITHNELDLVFLYILDVLLVYFYMTTRLSGRKTIEGSSSE